MTTPSIPAGVWELDASHSNVTFSVRHMMVAKVRGRFTDFTADIVTKDDPLDSTVNAVVQMASIDTNDEGRDNHLRTNDFFEIETYPEIRFASTAIRQSDETTFAVTGDLTIKDVTKPVTIEFEQTGSAIDPFGNTRVGFEGEITVNRKDWGLTWNAALETGGVLVSDKITLEFEVSAIKTA